MAEKSTKPDVFYDILNGKKKYYIGCRTKNSNGYTVTKRLTAAVYNNEKEAKVAWRKRNQLIQGKKQEPGSD